MVHAWNYHQLQSVYIKFGTNERYIKQEQYTKKMIKQKQSRYQKEILNYSLMLIQRIANDA